MNEKKSAQVMYPINDAYKKGTPELKGLSPSMAVRPTFLDGAKTSGLRDYELTDHLSNVMAVISDRKLSVDVNSDTVTDYYAPQVVSFTDYYPFGFPMVERSGNLNGYRFGFNGQEADGEIYGAKTTYAFEYRMQDTRLGRFWSVDPLARNYSGWSSFIFSLANPILYTDPTGGKVKPYNETSKNYMNQYLKEQFGTDKLFYYNRNNELKIRRYEYVNYIKTATASQIIVLSGLKKAISVKETAYVYVNSNSGVYPVRELQYDIGQNGYIETSIFPFIFSATGSGYTLPPRDGKNRNYYIFINNEKSEDEYVSGSRLVGKDDIISYYTGKSAGSVFIHELLDEFINYFVTKRVNDKSPQKDKVYYRNRALENIQKPISDGKDHQ